ncbi:MAG: FAD:protein FMN transferase [Nocardioides sp.]
MDASTFEALGTYVYVATRDPAELPAARLLTESLLRGVDRTCSRFRADSDLTRANAHAGRWTVVDPLLVAAVRVAVDAAEATDGLVHPLLGRSLASLGYDRDFGQLRDRGAVIPTGAPSLDAWRRLGVDDDAVRVPVGTALDLGATGKGFAADLVAAALDAELREPAFVGVGGDLAVSRPDEHSWPVVVSERPGAPGVTVHLQQGGLATSSTRVRRWARGGTTYHHVVDPRSGLPARDVWRTASCVGDTAAGANTASTASIVLGDAAPEWLERHAVTARLVGCDGRVRRTGAWPQDEDVAA